MDDTRRRYVVAGQYPSGIWNGYFACDDFGLAIKHFKRLCEVGEDRYKAAAVFTRAQWVGSRNTYRRHMNLRDRSNEPIPRSIGIWLINQADSSHF